VIDPSRKAVEGCQKDLSLRLVNGAGNGTRTRDIKLGKLALYQLSYARANTSRLTESSRPLERPSSNFALL
jgi:hypothetical protein